MEKKKIKVIISMEGGVIKSVLANTEDIEVLNIDCDDDDFGVDDDEIISDEEIERFADGDTFKVVENYTSGVLEEDGIPVIIE